MNKKYHKKIRLDAEVYDNPDLVCSVTVCTLDKKHILINKDFGRDIVQLIRERAEIGSVPIYAYCIMPDHVHLLLSASNAKSVTAFVRELKGLSTRLAWTYGIKGKLWQKSFYDHFLRKGEDIEKAVRYILDNPVRKGIVPAWRKYAFCGSLVYDLCGWG